MPKRHHSLSQPLTIHPVFEPSRLARKYLDEAYAYLVPKLHSSIPGSTPVKPADPPPTQSQRGTTT